MPLPSPCRGHASRMDATLSPAERRASLISDAAVERGRVNNALDKLRKVESERAQVELEASAEQRRMREQFA